MEPPYGLCQCGQRIPPGEEICGQCLDEIFKPFVEPTAEEQRPPPSPETHEPANLGSRSSAPTPAPQPPLQQAPKTKRWNPFSRSERHRLAGALEQGDPSAWEIIRTRYRAHLARKIGWKKASQDRFGPLTDALVENRTTELWRLALEAKDPQAAVDQMGEWMDQAATDDRREFRHKADVEPVASLDEWRDAEDVEKARSQADQMEARIREHRSRASEERSTEVRKVGSLLGAAAKRELHALPQDIRILLELETRQRGRPRKSARTGRTGSKRAWARLLMIPRRAIGKKLAYGKRRLRRRVRNVYEELTPSQQLAFWDLHAAARRTRKDPRTPR